MAQQICATLHTRPMQPPGSPTWWRTASPYCPDLENHLPKVLNPQFKMSLFPNFFTLPIKTRTVEFQNRFKVDTSRDCCQCSHPNRPQLLLCFMCLELVCVDLAQQDCDPATAVVLRETLLVASDSEVSLLAVTKLGRAVLTSLPRLWSAFLMERRVFALCRFFSRCRRRDYMFKALESSLCRFPDLSPSIRARVRSYSLTS
jgi:hypothetical protein